MLSSSAALSLQPLERPVEVVRLGILVADLRMAAQRQRQRFPPLVLQPLQGPMEVAVILAADLRMAAQRLRQRHHSCSRSPTRYYCSNLSTKKHSVQEVELQI